MKRAPWETAAYKHEQALTEELLDHYAKELQNYAEYLENLHTLPQEIKDEVGRQRSPHVSPEAGWNTLLIELRAVRDVFNQYVSSPVPHAASAIAETAELAYRRILLTELAIDHALRRLDSEAGRHLYPSLRLSTATYNNYIRQLGLPAFHLQDEEGDVPRSATRGQKRRGPPLVSRRPRKKGPPNGSLTEDARLGEIERLTRSLPGAPLYMSDTEIDAYLASVSGAPRREGKEREHKERKGLQFASADAERDFANVQQAVRARAELSGRPSASETVIRDRRRESLQRFTNFHDGREPADEKELLAFERRLINRLWGLDLETAAMEHVARYEAAAPRYHGRLPMTPRELEEVERWAGFDESLSFIDDVIEIKNIDPTQVGPISSAIASIRTRLRIAEQQIQAGHYAEVEATYTFLNPMIQTVLETLEANGYVTQDESGTWEMAE